LNFELNINLNKKDIVTIVLLVIVFLSIATVNLGATQYPSTTAQLNAGNSAYINLGSQVNVKSMIVLLYQGAFNITIYSGSPGNWSSTGSNGAQPYSSSGGWSEDYNKWYEVPVNQNTQYLRIDFGPTGGHPSTLSEIAVIDQDGKQVPIQSITDTSAQGTPTANMHNLVDEQNKVQYPEDYMSNTYFDEIYFVRTAQQYIDWRSHVLPYEWTHPPLGKLIQASGILMFGFTPFGWRIMGVIFAALAIPFIYLLGKKMFGTWIGGFTAAFLLTFDFMHFTMARMGTADTYLVAFNVASQLFFFIYLKNVLDKGWKTSVFPLILSFVFFSLALSAKFAIALYGFAAEILILLALRLSEVKNLKGTITDKIYGFLDRPYTWVVVSILIALGIYFAIYIPDMLIGRSFLDVINLQWQMYQYHSTLVATHPFASPWYSWPLLFDPFNWGTHTPLWLQVASLPNGLTSTIVLLGNPALWWTGFVIILGLAIYYVPQFFGKRFDFKANLPAMFIIIFFFFQWLPYIFITRVVFIYHFYVNVPFLCLGSAFVINKYWSNKWVKIMAVAFFALNIALFAWFYPVISGMPTSSSLIHSLTWFKSWIIG
jgi:dolichyl-phosphate-mannose-protein mannosyltransferase